MKHKVVVLGCNYYIGLSVIRDSRTRHIPELHTIGAAFLEKLKWKGFAEIEFKKDAETGRYYLIEINVRITNSNVLLREVGMNIPHITYCELTGAERIPPRTK